MAKRILTLTLVSLFVVLAYSVATENMLYYLLIQGKGQAAVLWNAQPIEKVKQERLLPDSLLEKLELVERIKQFGEQELGLVPTKNFQTVYNQNGQPILWVVNACPKFTLEPYKWNYPLLGKMGYKGYFKYELAEKEKLKFDSTEYDVSISEVSAWSTLGWFSDPILSSMLTKSEQELARLILHELAHATVFTNDDTFNENFATIVGDYGAYAYCKSSFFSGGPNTKLADEFLNQLFDKKVLSAHFKTFAFKIDSLYQSVEFNQLDYSKKLEIKQQYFDSMYTSANGIDFKSARYKQRTFTTKPANNTYLTSFLMYNANQDSLKNSLDSMYNGNLKAFIQGIKKEVE